MAATKHLTPVAATTIDDFQFLLRDWWPLEESASGRWFEYELRGPRGKALGVGDTPTAAITNASREYTRRFPL